MGVVAVRFWRRSSNVGGASEVGFAMPGEPWHVFMSEVNPNHAVIKHKLYRNSNGRLVTWNVAFQPKDGNAANIIAAVVTDLTQLPNVDTNGGTQGIPATVVHAFDERAFYVIVYCGVAGLEPGAVFRVTPPPFDPSGADGAGSTFVQGLNSATPVVVPWTTEKLTQDAASTFQLPTKGNSTGGWYPAHKTFMYLPPPMKGIVAMHDPSASPQFYRLS